MEIAKVIEKLLQDNEVIATIKRINDGKNVNMASLMIGEVYTYCFACNDGNEINKQDVIDYLNDRISDFNNPKTNHEDARVSSLMKAMSRRLNINFETASSQDLDKIKEYFLNNYIQKGYVMHSFPEACKKSIEKHGFSSSVRIWDSNEILEVAKMFQKHGILMPVGGYSYYNGGGMYVEADPRNVYWHSLSSPEWFRMYTSSKHSGTDMTIEESPFILRKHGECKNNVLNMCKMAGLTKEETGRAMKLFDENWKMLKSPNLPVALIPKSNIGKDKINADYKNKDASSTIKEVLNDSAKEYKEHGGNVLKKTLTKEQMTIITMPSADKFFKPQKYKVETKQELFNIDKNFNQMMGGVKNGFKLDFDVYMAIVEQMKETYKNNPDELEKLSVYQEMVNKIDNFPKVEKVSSEKIDETRPVNKFIGSEFCEKMSKSGFKSKKTQETGLMQ